MKITISPEEGETIEETVYENVIQFSLAGEMMRLKIYPAYFRKNVVADVNNLIGWVESLKEDLKDFKVKNDSST